MSSLYSTSLKFELIGTGDQTGIWGDTTNTNLGTAVEQAIVGKASLVTGDFTANVATLTLTDTNASQTARALVLDVTATLTAAGTINVPAVQKPYIVFNNTVGGFSLTVKVSGLTGVVVPNGKRMLVYNNGTDILDGLNYLNGTATNATTADVATLATSATTATTATNLSAGSTNTIPYQTGIGATNYITAPATPGYVLGWNGTNFVWVAGPAAVNAAALTGGSAGVVPYQSATDITAFTAVGASGQYLQSTGAGAPVWVTPSTNPGLGGTTSTTNVTLTASSPATLTVTPDTLGLYVTLPDATTCTKADNSYSIYNAGDYDYGVKDSTGTQLGWVRARTGAMIGLSDNTTAAGIWAYYGLEKLGVTATYTNLTSTNSAAAARRISLDADRMCFLFGGTSCYAVIYNSATLSWGSATLIRSGLLSTNIGFGGILSAVDQVLVFSCNSTTGLEAVTLTISGVGITVEDSTKATATLAGNISFFTSPPVLVGTSVVIGYGRATTTTAIRAISISGTTPTIGAEATISTAATFIPILFAVGSIVRTIGTSSTLVTCAPFTVSGSTLTAGTPATATSTGSNLRAFINGNGNLIADYTNTTYYVTIFKLTGTAEAASSVSIGTAPTDIFANSDFVQVTASKTAYLGSSTTAWVCNIVTDTAGTATAGTAVTGTTSASATVAQLPSTAGTASFGVADSSTYYSKTFDCSGASPVAAKSIRTALTTTNVIPPLSGVSFAGARTGLLVAGQVLYAINLTMPNIGVFTANIVGTSILRPPIVGNPTSIATAGSIGYSTALPTYTLATGIILQKVEAAA